MPDIYAHVNQTAKLHSSLPRVRLPESERNAPNLRNENLAATVEGKPRKGAPPYVDVVGQPSIKLQKLVPGPGIVVSITRKSKYTEFIPDRDLDGMRDIAKQMRDREKALSRGTLTPAELRRRHNPYGIGPVAPSGKKRSGLGRQTRMRGVSNMAVTNYQSGELYNAWEVEFIRNKSGVVILLKNATPQAEYGALGTPIMRKHGPYTTAPATLLYALNREWAKQSLRGYHQDMALRGFAE